MHRERLDRLRAERELPGFRALVRRDDAVSGDLARVALLGRSLAVALARGPVDQSHSHDHARDDAYRRGAEREVRALGPPFVGEDGCQTRRCAVAALEPDRDDRAEHRRYVEDAREHEQSDTDAHSVLSPRHYLPERELRAGDAPDLLERRDGNPQEERCENDVDEKARELAPAGRRVGNELV